MTGEVVDGLVPESEMPHVVYVYLSTDRRN